MKNHHTPTILMKKMGCDSLCTTLYNKYLLNDEKQQALDILLACKKYELTSYI